jgi:hypothetical protein
MTGPQCVHSHVEPKPSLNVIICHLMAYQMYGTCRTGFWIIRLLAVNNCSKANWFYSYLFFPFISGVWTFGTAVTTGLLYQPRMIGDCGEIGGM